MKAQALAGVTILDDEVGERPFWVTLNAGWLGINAMLMAESAFVFELGWMDDGFLPWYQGLPRMAAGLLLGWLLFLLARGLWRMKNWARLVVLVGNLVTVGACVGALVTAVLTRPVLELYYLILPLLVGGFYVSYYFRHAGDFR